MAARGPAVTRLAGSPGTSAGLPGISIDAVDMRRALERCTEAVDADGYLCVGMVNAAKVVAMSKDASLRSAVAGCGMALADGQAVVWASAGRRRPGVFTPQAGPGPEGAGWQRSATTSPPGPLRPERERSLGEVEELQVSLARVFDKLTQTVPV